MKTSELLERIEVRSLGQRDLRVGASKLFAHEIRKLAGSLEWSVSGHGDDNLAAAAQVVMEADPRVRRKVDRAVSDLRALAKDIDRVDPSETAIDIGRGLARRHESRENPRFFELQSAEKSLMDAYLSVHSLKADLDAMHEIPQQLDSIYKALLKSSGMISDAKGIVYNARMKARRVHESLSESVSRHCAFYKARDGKWYMELAPDEHGEERDAFTYGPFRSDSAAEKYLHDNFSNPGSDEYDDSGNAPVPKRSPNGSPVQRP